MTATDTLTARRLYDTDATMRAFIASWDAERRCPMPLVDFLLEHGLSSAAEAARWAATKGDRPVLDPCRYLGERGGACGLYPALNNLEKKKPREWFWGTFGDSYASDTCGLADFHWASDENSHQTAIDAIAWLLDNWRLPT